MDAEQWGFVLLALEDAGWKPPRSTLWYIATGTEVSHEEAADLANAADVLFNAPLEAPVWANSLYSRRLDLNVFYSVAEFLRGGAFRIG